MKKIGLLKVIAVLLSLTLCSVGCGKSTPTTAAGSQNAAKTEDAKETAAATHSSAASNPDVKIGLVVGVDGLGDKNMNDMGYEGCLKAQKELGIAFDYTTPTSLSDIETAIRMYAETEEYALIVCLGAAMKEAVVNVSKDFPDQKFTWFDGSLDAPNVNSISTIWPQQTFLCGVIAGLGTQSDMPLANKDSNLLGCILGMEQPFLVAGTIGFEAGARYVNPKAEVLHATVGGWSDPGTAKEMALSMYGKGADFIQHIAGGSGLGVFNAAVEANRYAFGVGSNQNEVEPEHIVATSLKDVRAITFADIQHLLDGSWKGGITRLGMAGGATGYTTEGSKVVLPANILKAVEEIKQMVVDGKITPPSSREEMEEWLKTNQYEFKP